MPIGNSGRIVVVVDPELKQELHAALAEDGLNMRSWFIQRAEHYLSDRIQPSFDLVADGDEKDRRYG